MLDSIYTGLTGLASFSKSLSNISNNVANLNTPGFKRSQVLFKDLFYNRQPMGDSGAGSGNDGAVLGNGVAISTTSTVFKQGELRQSGNAQDAAIDGNGLFILRNENGVSYTRDGQFQFDEKGYLVSKNSGVRVAVLDSTNQLKDFNVLDSRVNPPQATTQIIFDGNLSANDSDNKQEINGITIYNSNGDTSTLKIEFTNNGALLARDWLFQIFDQVGNTVASGHLQFQGDGSPVSGLENFIFNYTSPGGVAQSVKFNFGSPGGFSGMTNFSTGADSTAKVLTGDGYTVGSITKVGYGEDGQITISYSNGQTSKLNKLALAWFTYLPGLTLDGGNVFINASDQSPIIGAAKTAVFGKITGGSIEASNVDLTQQFSELIVTQRGYQASSQIVSAANEMIQQLLDLKGKR
jgi:flagellar hook protein FlgE